jgi:hypothetical protein
VQVQDENRKPVAGTSVIFKLPQSGPSGSLEWSPGAVTSSDEVAPVTAEMVFRDRALRLAEIIIPIIRSLFADDESVSAPVRMVQESGFYR